MSLPILSSFYPKDKKEDKKESSTVEATPGINPDGLKDSAKHVNPVTELKETLQKERKASLPDLPELKKVEAEEKKEEVSKKENYIRREFNYQSFSRTFSLPDTIDENKIEANYKDGILHVVVGKKEGLKKRALKSIPIK